MEEGKEKLIGTIGTIVFHALIIIFLLLFYLKPSVDNHLTDDLGGVPVMFGNVENALGNDEAFGRGDGTTSSLDENAAPNLSEEDLISPPSQPDNVTTTSKNDKGEINTQDLEETIALKEAQKKAAAEKKRQDAIVAEQNKKKAEAERIAKAEAAKRAQIAQNMGGAFGNGTGNGSRGETTGSGTQGVVTGNASSGKTSGVGGWGSYDLGGRGVGSGGLVKPVYTANDYGTIVVAIVVDPKGNVLEATIARGTNTANATLRSEARKAALKTKFSSINKSGNQSGTITYKFNLN